MSDNSGLQFVSPYAFEAMQKVDVVRLAALSDPELRLLLPCLVRMALCAPADQSQSWAQDKKLILRLLSGVEAVNSIVALLSVDFHALEQDARKEQQLRYSWLIIHALLASLNPTVDGCFHSGRGREVVQTALCLFF